MSAKPIWDLRAKRSELGHASKGVIYLSKIAIGAAVAVPLWLLHNGDLSAVIVSTLAVFITTKVCYYVDRHESPQGWDTLADWCCDGSLHCAWLLVPWLSTGHYGLSLALVAAWAITYPWSCE